MSTSWLNKIRTFLTHDMWSEELSSLPGLQGFVVRGYRVAQLIVRGFRDDDLPVRASALTFSTLVSLVPVLAIALALLRGLGAGDAAIANVHESLVGMPEQFRDFVDQMLAIVEKTNFWALGWVGVLVLFLTVIQVLSSVESTFNKVWGVHSSRGIWRRIANYVSVTVIVPVLITAAFAVSATLSSDRVVSHLGNLAGIYLTLLKATPLVSVAVAFFFLLIFVPSTRVRVRPAIGGALIAALLWISWQKLYITLQLGVARYNAIYGTFASVPIFLAWLYVCWVIILLGAEISFALQNHETFHMERSAGNASMRSRIMLAFSIAYHAARGFLNGEARFDLEAFSHSRTIPIRLVQDIVRQLERGNMLAQVADADGCYVLVRPPDRIRLREIVDLIAEEGSGPDVFGFDRNPEKPVAAAMEHWEQSLTGDLDSTTLADLVKTEA